MCPFRQGACKPARLVPRLRVRISQQGLAGLTSPSEASQLQTPFLLRCGTAPCPLLAGVWPFASAGDAVCRVQASEHQRLPRSSRGRPSRAGPSFPPGSASPLGFTACFGAPAFGCPAFSPADLSSDCGLSLLLLLSLGPACLLRARRWELRSLRGNCSSPTEASNSNSPRARLCASHKV